MSDFESVRLPPPPRRRRTQAERTAATRARIVAATVESINEVGFQRTTASEIARRSGVTWGAVQHHFGTKDGVLGAILEDSFNRFAKGLAEAFASLGPEAPLAERISTFVDRAWSHYASAHYRAVLEILLEESTARRADPERSDTHSWQVEMLNAWTRLWRRLFPDVRMSTRRAQMLQHYTIGLFTGLASMKILAGREPPFCHEELDLLKRTLAAEFENPGGASQRR